MAESALRVTGSKKAANQDMDGSIDIALDDNMAACVTLRWREHDRSVQNVTKTRSFPSINQSCYKDIVIMQRWVSSKL